MPKFLRNWKFGDVVLFLEQHFFILRNVEGSHYYYRGYVDDSNRVCHVQRHPDETIHPKTLKKNIIEKSGIPEHMWLSWSMSGAKRKKVQYLGAKPWQPPTR